MTLAVLAILILLPLIGFFMARAKAVRIKGSVGPLHSLPSYHAAYVALWTGLPTLVLFLAWSALREPMIDTLVLGGLPEAYLAKIGNRGLVLAEIQNVASGRLFSEPSAEVRDAAARYNWLQNAAGYSLIVVAAAVALLGLVWSRSRLTAAFRARTGVERIITGLMILSSAIAILTTIGIILSLVFESAQFFRKVPWHEFLFGLRWEPQIAIRADQVAGHGAFGAIPVFLGTLVIATLAMFVALPIGLFSAIYMTEFATPRFRAAAKPILEVLAGIPTVVYGFFAVLTVAPALSSLGAAIGFDVAPNSALVAGGVMGIMIIPFISSLSDDAITAVPQSLRDGALALGATRGETVMEVLVPAALPGIVGGALLAVSRAIGETMIVVMAAGLIAKMTVNPFEAVTTVTVQIVTLLIGDTEFDSPKTLAAFGLGLVLFIITLGLNFVALRIVQKYREKYD
jgi:phosphate transport system permease protein